MGYKINLIVACCENRGIGINGQLPWSLKNEMKYFSRITKRTVDASKKNAVIMGRNTWESIPAKFRPLPNRLNILVSTKATQTPEEYQGCTAVPSFPDAITEANKREGLETLWIIGGASIYKAALESSHVHRIYITKILTAFECDTFLPVISLEDFIQVTEVDVSQKVQQEGDIKYKYEIYEKKT